jgi:hypothetical protein
VGEQVSVRKLGCVVIFLLVGLSASCWGFEGPLQVRNQFPIYLGMAPPFFESAAVQDALWLHLSHSSVFLVKESTDWKVGMDLEMTELEIRLKKKVGPSTELGVEVPFERISKGFLDRPVAFIHDTLGTGDYDRHTRPVNEFLYDVQYLGSPVILPQERATGIGDIRVTVKQVLFERPFLLSFAGGAELPTGSTYDGFGNGSWDLFGSLLANLDLGTTYCAFGNAGLVLPGDLRGYQTIGLRNFAYGALGIEAAWWERMHFIAQLMVQGSPYPVTGIRQLDWPGVLLVLGGRYHLEKGNFEFSLTEDLDTAGAPDFILNVSYNMSF